MGLGSKESEAGQPLSSAPACLMTVAAQILSQRPFLHSPLCLPSLGQADS